MGCHGMYRSQICIVQIILLYCTLPTYFTSKSKEGNDVSFPRVPYYVVHTFFSRENTKECQESRPGLCTRGKSWSGEWVLGVTRVKIPTGGCRVYTRHPLLIRSGIGCGQVWVFIFFAPRIVTVPTYNCCPSASFAFF